jgi:hypothetical protein
MIPDYPPTLYRHHDAGAAAPSDDARWAITVQSGEDDPHPRILAYARAEHIAKRMCMAMRLLLQSSLEAMPAIAAAYVAEKQATRVDPD